MTTAIAMITASRNGWCITPHAPIRITVIVTGHDRCVTWPCRSARFAGITAMTATTATTATSVITAIIAAIEGRPGNAVLALLKKC
ncbi:MAG: hypothetical protein A3J25_07140 [Pseudomonadales bacterium RIFCSPLOWO2_02_FULL_63_210]|nr:MAG: hypothetical protein A3J25_07140 [Pseudomonadales bacterium RIFCSPLOWO2_02_FULL_63_210]